MRNLSLQPNATAEWHNLVCEAEQATTTFLEDDIEHYLVLLLLRFTDQPAVISSILGLDFLEGCQQASPQQHGLLRDVADKCLLFTGLFPGFAEKRRVSLGYFVSLGRSAYDSLTILPEKAWLGPYSGLCQDFLTITTVLQGMREIASDAHQMSYLHAFEMWQMTASASARQRVDKYMGKDSILVDPDSKWRH